MGGKSGGGGNDAVVQEQQKEAADARAKEAERQARISQGLEGIKSAFEGSAVMGNRSQAFDWGGFKPPAATAMATQDASGKWIRGGPKATGLPAGYEAIQVDDPNWKAPAAAAPTPAATAGGISAIRRAGVPAAATRPAANGYISGFGAGGTMNGMMGGGTNQGSGGGPAGAGVAGGAAAGGGAGAGGPGKVWAIRGPDGKLHYSGENFSYDSSYDTGQRSGGFGDKFYDDYGKAITDYYQPQVNTQYKDATDELTYRLARAGTLRSSAGATETADLAKQYDLQNADVLNKADAGKAALRSQVASERAKAENQLYATENPTTAVNTALASVRDVSMKGPDVSPLAALFDIATIGGAGFAGGLKNQSLANRYKQLSPKGASTAVGY